MSRRARLSRERFYRCFSACLAVCTALLLVPADWLRVESRRPEPKEPEPREIEIVRVSPEEIPPPPPLPEPEPVPEPEPEPKEPEPEPEPKMRPMLETPDVVVPREKRQRRRQRLEQEVSRAQLRRQMDQPDVEVPREKRVQRRMEIVAERQPERVRAQDEPVEVTVPKEVPREDRRTKVEVASATRSSYHDAEAPDVNVVTPRPAARKSQRPSVRPVSRRLKTGAAAQPSEDAPDVDVPSGNTAEPGRRAAIAVSGPAEGTRVTYDQNPGAANQVAVASPKRSSEPGAAPRLAVTSGGADGPEYSAAPSDVAVGGAPGAQSGAPGGTKLGKVASALSRKYGLPLVRVSNLGKRSTEAARWNVLLPQISDLVRKTGSKEAWRADEQHNVLSIRRDGDAVIIRYRDGITHVLVPTPNGLTAMYVSAESGARPVVSKVEEAEQAKKALTLYDRGAS